MIKKLIIPITKVIAFLFTLWGLSVTVKAQASDELSIDRIWSYATLYENKDSNFLKKFSLSGRLQGDVTLLDADQGSFDNILWRRYRFGFVSEFVSGWRLHLEGDFDQIDLRGERYERLTDAYIVWQPNESIEVKLLKQSAGFTMDGATSSKKLLTLERNNLTRNLWFSEEYFTGITLRRNFNGQHSFKVGLFSSDDSNEIGITDASYFLLASLSYTLDIGPKFDETSIHLDYVYNDKDTKCKYSRLVSYCFLLHPLADGPLESTH